MQHLRDARHRPALNQIEVTWAGALFNALQTVAGFANHSETGLRDATNQV